MYQPRAREDQVKVCRRMGADGSVGLGVSWWVGWDVEVKGGIGLHSELGVVAA